MNTVNHEASSAHLIQVKYGLFLLKLEKHNSWLCLAHLENSFNKKKIAIKRKMLPGMNFNTCEIYRETPNERKKQNKSKAGQI